MVAARFTLRAVTEGVVQAALSAPDVVSRGWWKMESEERRLVGLLRRVFRQCPEKILVHVEAIDARHAASLLHQLTIADAAPAEVIELAGDATGLQQSETVPQPDCLPLRVKTHLVAAARQAAVLIAPDATDSVRDWGQVT